MIGSALRRRVRDRADNRCEYCGMQQEDEPFIAYQIEHIIAIQHGGADTEDNLALACSHCNLHKGPNLSGIDPTSERIETLFHPRQQRWDEHFGRHGDAIIGKTPTGRATVRVFAMNSSMRRDLRREIQAD